MAEVRCPQCGNVVANRVGNKLFIGYRRRHYMIEGEITDCHCEQCQTHWQPAPTSLVHKVANAVREALGLPPTLDAPDEADAGDSMVAEIPDLPPEPEGI